jgi:predicted transglutaminase-like cysteine proteinase
MPTFSKWIFAIAALLTGLQSASAGFVGLPRSIGTLQRISFNAPSLPPMAFTQFCMRYADQCRPNRMRFRGGPIRMTKDRWEALKEVNRYVNDSIAPEINYEGLAGEKWLIGPSSGDCNDYAVTKRAELIERGWPSRTLLLSEVVTAWGEHHLVVVVRTSTGDFVLDNMTRSIRSWSQTPYQWLRMQTPGNPNYWASIATRRA